MRGEAVLQAAERPRHERVHPTCTWLVWAVRPLMRYLFFPPITTWRVTVSLSYCWYPNGLFAVSSLLKTRVTVAFCTPAWPCLYTSSCKLLARTCARPHASLL